MSTKRWSNLHTGENGEPSLNIYKDLFEPDVLYFELKGVWLDVHLIHQQ